MDVVDRKHTDIKQNKTKQNTHIICKQTNKQTKQLLSFVFRRK